MTTLIVLWIALAFGFWRAETVERFLCKGELCAEPCTGELLDTFSCQGIQRKDGRFYTATSTTASLHRKPCWHRCAPMRHLAWGSCAQTQSWKALQVINNKIQTIANMYLLKEQLDWIWDCSRHWFPWCLILSFPNGRKMGIDFPLACMKLNIIIFTPMRMGQLCECFVTCESKGN